MTYLKTGLRALIVALAVSAGASFAQETHTLDFAAWDKRAQSAERSLAEGGASDTTLNAMRSQLQDWRETFVSEQESVALRRKALHEQLEALGAAPEDGTSEAAEITARRAELTEQLAGVEAPAKLAQEAATRAASLIEEIDRELLRRTQPDYENWAMSANEAEARLQNGRSSDQILEELREDIAEWRAEFLVAQDANQARLKTLQSQQAALGEAPEDGVEETPEIAQRRKELSDQIARLAGPAKRAEEAYTRADGIIGEIDSTLRERQTDKLLSLGASPLNPVYWPDALDALRHMAQAAWHELAVNLQSDLLRQKAREKLPLIIMLLLAGLVMVAKGRHLARLDLFASLTSTKRRGGRVWSSLMSVVHMLLPIVGTAVLAFAFYLTEMAGPRLEIAVVMVPLAVGFVLSAHWLADRCFHEDDQTSILVFAPGEKAAARRHVTFLALIFAVQITLGTYAQFDQVDPDIYGVISFPLIVLSAWTLYRLGRTRQVDETPQPVEERSFRYGLAMLIGRALILISLAAPVLAAIGYGRLAEQLIYPAIATLYLVGAVMVLQRFLSDLYVALAGEQASEHDSLLPVLGGFAVSLLALPLLALIWGARVSDLTELWTRFREGFQLGDTKISPTDFLLVIVVFIVGYLVTRFLQGALRTSVLPKTRIDKGAQNAVVSGVGYLGIFASAVVAITLGGLDLSSLAIVAGALSVGIGFGLQNIVSNFVSGIILLIERPISEGDWIEVNGTHGTVKDISVRSTRMETFDRVDVIIPNSDLVSGTVSNYTKGNVLGRLIVSVGVAYGTDTRKVERILLDIARQHPLVLMNPAPYVYFKGFGADSMDFEIRAILRDVNNSLGTRTEMNHQIVERFAEEGIEIPFAQRDIWIRNPEAISQVSDGVGAMPTVDASKTAGGRVDDTDGEADY